MIGSMTCANMDVADQWYLLIWHADMVGIVMFAAVVACCRGVG